MTEPGSAPIVVSGRQLLRSTVIALCVAGVILVAVVLPAEYGVDPTRVGSFLGLTAMGKSKAVARVQADVADQSDGDVMHAHPRKAHNGRVEIQMHPREELEYKATLAKGEPLLYSWSVQGGPVYFEFHGEPTEGKWPEGFYQSYQIGDSSEAEQGSFVAPFTGQHGWYWRNLSDAPATIVLEASGYYTKLGRIGSSAVVE